MELVCELGREVVRLLRCYVGSCDDLLRGREASNKRMLYCEEADNMTYLLEMMQSIGQDLVDVGQLLDRPRNDLVLKERGDLLAKRWVNLDASQMPADDIHRRRRSLRLPCPGSQAALPIRGRRWV